MLLRTHLVIGCSTPWCTVWWATIWFLVLNCAVQSVLSSLGMPQTQRSKEMDCLFSFPIALPPNSGSARKAAESSSVSSSRKASTTGLHTSRDFTVQLCRPHSSKKRSVPDRSRNHSTASTKAFANGDEYSSLSLPFSPSDETDSDQSGATTSSLPKIAAMTCSPESRSLRSVCSHLTRLCTSSR